MADVALVPQRDVLERRHRVAADHAGQAADALGGDGVALVGHRRAALLPLGEGLLGLPHLGALQVAQLGGEPVERARRHGQRRDQLGVAVAGDHLRRRRLRAEPELRHDLRLEIGREHRVRPDRSGELADADPGERVREALLVAAALEGVPGELQAERRRLGVDAVRAPDAERVGVLDGSRDAASRSAPPARAG